MVRESGAGVMPVTVPSGRLAIRSSKVGTSLDEVATPGTPRIRVELPGALSGELGSQAFLGNQEEPPWRGVSMRVKKTSVSLMLRTIFLASVSIAGATEPPPREISPASFVATIDNPFFPLSPGTTFLYEGVDEGVPTSTRTFVTRETKRILGVNCTVVHDQAFENGVLVEDTFDWYAQDVNGNVWYFGEDTKELDSEGNVISTEGSWQAGVNDARPGIIMLWHPRESERYYQEFARGVAEDVAQVLSLDESTCTRYGCFAGMLLTKETTRLEPGIVEHKFYAPGIGFVLGVRVKGGEERTELTRVRG